MRLRLETLVGAFLFLVLAGCAFDLAHVRYKTVEYVPAPEAQKSFVLGENLEITEGTCYSRTLRKGKTWKLTGRIAEGETYKSSEQIFTLECSNVHEAFLVVANDRIVGYFLPVEKGFVRLSKPLKITMQ